MSFFLCIGTSIPITWQLLHSPHFLQYLQQPVNHHFPSILQHLMPQFHPLPLLCLSSFFTACSLWSVGMCLSLSDIQGHSEMHITQTHPHIQIDMYMQMSSLDWAILLFLILQGVHACCWLLKKLPLLVIVFTTYLHIINRWYKGDAPLLKPLYSWCLHLIEVSSILDSLQWSGVNVMIFSLLSSY